jgi:probable HAF family extracellular repeat protein
VYGSGFDAGSKAQWALKGVPSPKVTTNSTRFVSSRELVANITIAADADPALYDVIVTTASGKPGIGTESFEVTIEMTDLGNLGFPYAEALAVNDAGQIVGISNKSSSTWSSFLWENGVMKDIGMPAGFTSSRPEDINNLGQVAGYAMVQVNGAWVSRGFSWTSSGGYQLLPGFNGSTSNQVMAINDNGEIVGYSGGHAVKWVNGSIVDLGTGAVPYDINANGDIAADCSGAACRWTASTGWQLVQTMSGTQGEALGINADGSVVGWGPVNGSTTNYAYVNRGGVPQNLGMTGGENSVGRKISIHGHIAGRGANGKPVLWYADGSMILLNSLRTNYGGEAADVNANGWVVGFTNIAGRRGSEKHAVRWRIF